MKTPAPHWKQLRSGIAFDVLDPTPESIRIDDIAHALALTNRYGGHTAEPYSVAQHSVLCAMAFASSEFQRWALLHDAAEAYLGDLSGPLKRLPQLAGFLEIEKNLQRAIYARFGLHGEPPAWVKDADLVILAIEADAFFPVSDRPADWQLPPPELDFDVTPWSWTDARAEFLRWFEMLFPEHVEVAA